MNKLCERLIDLRGDCKQKDIAIKIGIQPPAYSKYERGTREPDIDTLIKIATYFNVTVDYLIGFEDKSYLSKFMILENVKNLENEIVKIKKQINNSK